MQLALAPESLAAIAGRVAAANPRFQQHYPGDSTGRQPVHTVYGGAQLFKVGSAQRLGGLALASLDEYAPDFAAFARTLGLPGAERLPEDPASAAHLAAELARDEPAARLADPQAWLAWTVYWRVREKLLREPVEDLRIDFEDGYGSRPSAEEDAHAAAVAEQLAAGTLPPFIGIRVKSFAPETFGRAACTLDITLTALAARTGSALPANFVVTLAKVVDPAHVAALADLLDIIEVQGGIAPGAVKIDLMIELPQVIVGPDGACGIGSLVRAGRGRVASAAFGTYDYTASCNITAHEQRHTQPAADFARSVMQASLAGTGVNMSDSVTTTLPIAPQRAAPGQPLAPQQQAENRAAVHSAWRLHYDNVRHSLRHGFYQGWDLHPAQLPVRYAAVSPSSWRACPTRRSG